MADSVRKVNYCYTHVSNRAGQGAKVLDALADGGVDLVAYTGFPEKGGKAQLDFVTENLGALRRVAKRNGWRLSKTKKAFWVQGQDKPGAVAKHVDRLAAQKINITAADAICAGKGRYGMLLWVKPKDYGRAAKVLKAK